MNLSALQGLAGIVLAGVGLSLGWWGIAAAGAMLWIDYVLDSRRRRA